MMNKHSGRPRGFGFVTFTNSAVADEVLAQQHTIDGRVVEVKRTVPRGNMEATAVFRTKKIFVGRKPQFLTDDELKEHFSPYGNIVEHQIMLDYQTGRSRGFGFVTFDSEDSVEKVVSAGIMHELGGKQVEIKRTEPKRPGVDYSSTSRNSYVGFGNEMNGFGGHNIGKGGGPYTDSGMNEAYSHYDGSYSGNSATAYGGYCGYGYGFGYGGPMYCFGGYGVNSYVNPGGYGAIATYGDGNAYGRRVGGSNGTCGYDSGNVAEKDESPCKWTIPSLLEVIEFPRSANHTLLPKCMAAAALPLLRFACIFRSGIGKQKKYIIASNFFCETCGFWNFLEIDKAGSRTYAALLANKSNICLGF